MKFDISAQLYPEERVEIVVLLRVTMSFGVALGSNLELFALSENAKTSTVIKAALVSSE